MKNTARKNPNIKKGRKILMFPLILLSLVLVLTAFIMIVANNNVKAMNHCIDNTIKELQKTHTVTAVDLGTAKEMTINGFMKFHVEQYRIEGIGNLSVMRINMGLMQMATFVITPKEKNLPLLSADYMYILTTRKSYLEFYDVVPEKNEQYLQLLSALQNCLDKYSHLENITPSEAWYQHLLTVTAYKSGGPKSDITLEKMLVDALKVYSSQAKSFPALTQAEIATKKAITMEYTDGLIQKGGISTDVFKSSLGDDATKEFFDNIFFGTAIE